MAPPVEGNGLALSTGTAGCSAYQIDSKPSRSACRARKAGSMVYAGNGMASPIIMSVTPSDVAFHTSPDHALKEVRFAPTLRTPGGSMTYLRIALAGRALLTAMCSERADAAEIRVLASGSF